MKTAKAVQNCSVKISPAAVPAYLGVLVIEDLVMAFFARCHLLHRALACFMTVQHWKQTAWIGSVMLVMQRFSRRKKTENEAAPNSRSRWKTEPGEKSPCHSPPLVASNIGLRQFLQTVFQSEKAVNPAGKWKSAFKWHFDIFQVTGGQWFIVVCWNTRRCLPLPCLQKKDMTLIQIRFYPSNKETLSEVLHILDKQTEKTLSSLAPLTGAAERQWNHHTQQKLRIQGAEPFKSLLGQYLTTM